eukprot:CAMPEP_0185018886 /NCGR_PEP_ID=MMETSP1103-20130426/1562_1 /TAXON_ID=36769 /ORGANISM="Paraphysomonas bandaiensis, Strain Caron Lab Isolate" /LENGTH=441 /DNA_ID=CAMNT_0027548925 /DNA_START=161 /DNA_END=1487 /DNA_ORIENTATION=-
MSNNPVFLFRPHRVLLNADWFTQHFPGEVYYAVKANPSPHILRELYKGGVRGFDVASLYEVQLVYSLFPNAKLAFMHPIKNRGVITRVYNEYGVRRYVLDSQEELDKILEATNFASDLILIVRFAVSNYGSSLPLTGKFGVHPDQAPTLLREARKYASKLGISFHVGSQSMKPQAYELALSSVASQIRALGDVSIDIVDVGGGFPSVYDMDCPPPMVEYIEAVSKAVKDLDVFSTATLWCEPGRGLSAEGEGLLTRIEGVKRGTNAVALYLNDGSYGALYDVVHEQWKYPVRVVKASGVEVEVGIEQVEYIIYGPTCDSADKFPETLLLPAGLEEGDYLEWGNIGAYGRSMATVFNGFGYYETVIVDDSPWPSLYDMGDESTCNLHASHPSNDSILAEEYGSVCCSSSDGSTSPPLVGSFIDMEPMCNLQHGDWTEIIVVE